MTEKEKEYIALMTKAVDSLHKRGVSEVSVKIEDGQIVLLEVRKKRI